MDRHRKNEDLVAEITCAIIGGNSDLMVALLKDNSSYLKEQGWTILSLLNDQLQHQDLRSPQLGVVQMFFEHMVDVGNPKELAYAFLESCNAFKNSSLYETILPFLAQVLLQLPSKHRSLDLVCGTLYSHIKSLAWTSKEYGITENEAERGMVLPSKNDFKTDQIVHHVSGYIQNFIHPLAENFAVDESSNTFERQVITSSVLQVLNYPLLYIFYDKTDKMIVDCVEVVLNALIMLNPTVTNIFTLDYYTSQSATLFSAEHVIEHPVEQAFSSTNDDEEDSFPGLANLAYLLFSECLFNNHVPQMLSSKYTLTVVFPCLYHLYTRSTNSVVAVKATSLLTSFLSCIGAAELDDDFLELPFVNDTIVYICWMMQFSHLLVVRRSAAKILPQLISKFDHQSRFHLFQRILNNEESPEILSYTYSLVKDFIHECWSTEDFAKGPTFALALMQKIFQVPDGEGGKLIADLDKISAALNLARYLVTRDKNRTAQYTKQMSTYIQSYIKPVGQCLQTELVRLKSALKEVNTGEYKPPEIGITVAVGDETIDSTKGMEREAIVGSISRVELVIFVHDCLTDVLNN